MTDVQFNVLMMFVASIDSQTAKTEFGKWFGTLFVLVFFIRFLISLHT